jgi:hypothetical protein
MTRGNLVIAGVIAALLLCAATGQLRHHTSVAEIDAVLRERIRPGASPQDVMDVLDSLHVENSGLMRQNHVIYAVWRRTSVGLISETALAARFYFTPGRRLIRYELEEQITAW